MSILAWLLCLSPAVLGAQESVTVRSAAAVAFDAQGNLYIADASGSRVYEATLAGNLIVLAGNGVQGFGGDGGSAPSAQLNEPQGVTVAADGTVLIADTGNQRIRAVSPAGTIRTIAGTGVAGFGGDGGPALSGTMRGPTALAAGPNGSVVFCDTGNSRVRELDAEGNISTLAGNGVQGFAGDGNQASEAELDSPAGIAIAADGTIYVADTHNHRVRRIAPSGVIATFAGTGTAGFTGDGGPAVYAELFLPRGLALDASGNLLVADRSNERIRVVSPTGTISTIAGSGVEGTSLDSAPAAAAALHSPQALAVSPFGTFAFADGGNRTVRVQVSGARLFQPAALAAGRVSVVQAPGQLQGTYGQVSLQVSVAGMVAVPQGRVTWSTSAGNTQVVQLNGGTAQVNADGLNAGTFDLQWTYNGDGLNPAATATPVHLTVNPAQVTAHADPVTITYGDPVPVLSGTLAGVLPQDAGAVTAVFQAPGGELAPVGSYSIAGSLAGTKAADYAVTQSPSSGQLTVVKASSAIALAPAASLYTGVKGMLTATVTSTTRGQPTGTVQFFAGESLLGSATLQAGTASIGYTAAEAGTQPISVAYLGDANFLPSGAAPGDVLVSALPDFSLVAQGNNAASVSAGSAATFTVAVGAQPGPFTGAVVLSATGMPAGALVSFSPPAVVPGSGTAVVTLTVQTLAAVAANRPHSGKQPDATQHWGVVLAGMATCGVGCRRRKRRQFLRRSGMTLLLPFAAGVLLLVSGCGARVVQEATGGTASSTYTLQISGTATNLAGAVVVHTVPITLTVQAE